MSSLSAWFYARRKNLLLSVVSILLMLVVGEVGLQVLYRVTTKSWLWQYNAFHVTFVAPVSDRREYTLRPGFSDSQIGVTVNAKGFRAPASMPEPDPAQPVIVTLGDSKPFGSGVRDDETYPYQLDQLLRAKGSKLRAINAGVASYDMRQALDRYRLEVAPNYQPAVVVIQGAFNDISLLTYYRDKWNPDRTWADIRFHGFTPPLPGMQKLATLYYLNRALSRHSAGNANTGEVEYSAYPDDKMLANLRAELEEFISACEAKKLPVVLMPIDPFYYQTANQEKKSSLPLWASDEKFVQLWKDMLSRHDQLLVELSNKHELVYFFDTRKLLDATDRGPLYVDGFHYSRKGNQLIAEGLFDFLSQKNLLTPAAAPAAK